MHNDRIKVLNLCDDLLARRVDSAVLSNDDRQLALAVKDIEEFRRFRAEVVAMKEDLARLTAAAV
jgi:hypothetical protein